MFKFSIDPKLETAESLEKKTLQVLCDLFKSVLSEIKADGQITRRAITNNGGKYISRQQMLDMMKVDLEKETAEEIIRKSRAFWFPPYNGAYIEKDGIKFTLVSDFILKQLVKESQTINGGSI